MYFCKTCRYPQAQASRRKHAATNAAWQRMDYAKKHPEKQKERNRASYLKYKQPKITDPVYKLKTIVRARVISAFKKGGLRKCCKTMEMLGCDYKTLMSHIESKFEPWMTWDKHGKYNGKPQHGFDIDHIIPLSTARTPEEIIHLSHYTNLQPLCSYVNRRVKRARTDFKTEELCTQR